MAVVGYATCSSLMLVTNKLAVHHVPTPSFLLFLQLFSTAVAVKGVGLAGMIEVDSLTIPKITSFVPVAFAFLAVIFTNMKTLQYCNVETFIVFRASTPLLVSLGDYFFLNRALPSGRSWLTLLVLLSGALVYVFNDSSFHVTGYSWVGIWYAIFCFDQLYIKHVISTVKMDSNWGRVFYTNLIGAFPLALMGLGSGEMSTLMAFEWKTESIVVVSLSCLLGIAMSYFAFLCRHLVSATMFTVIGNCCKLVSVIINLMIWDKHASNLGLAALFCCLLAAYFYKQAPERPLKTTSGV